MHAMWQIGLRMPILGDASMRILGCRVYPDHATCRLEIRQQGYDTCRVRLELRHRHVDYPAQSWHCAPEWRPVELRRVDLKAGQQQKAIG